nr:immunoglobulin heavy chain junction region [Macaca mulatta]MOV50626.1 immunoglobulin heavy chain junction region [Macaca mulatta]MOV52192.1 immunoglobulin heavy chain junction region [Macaca mulatta]MOV52998.1 immunoglobulin heavy chain junction region [Macaca mulatta]
CARGKGSMATVTVWEYFEYW